MREYLAVLVVGLVAVGVSVIPARSALAATVTAGQFWTVITHHDNTFLYANLGSGKCMAQQIADPLFTKTGPVFQTNCDESSAVWMNAV